MTIAPVCRKCDVDLVSPDNWRPYLAKKNSRICTPCRRADEIKYLNDNPSRREKMKEVSAAWRAANPEAFAAGIKRWQEANPNYAKERKDRAAKAQ